MTYRQVARKLGYRQTVEVIMQTYRVETTIANHGALTIEGLPFRAGDRVEVVVRSCEPEREPTERYPLRGQGIEYADPFGSVAGEDWDALR